MTEYNNQNLPEEEIPTDEEQLPRFYYLRTLFSSKLVFIPVIITLISLAVSLISYLSVSFAEGYCRTVGSFIRMVLAKITGIFPFSVAETLVAAFLIFLVYSLFRSFYVIFSKTDSVEFEDRANKVLICIFLCAFSLYNFSFAPSNHRRPLEENLGLEREPLSSEQLYECMVKVTEELKVCLDNGDIRRTPSGSSCLPYSYTELSDVLNGIYRDSYEKYPFLSRFDSKAKLVMLSPLMTYTHISGIYVPFTGEININTNYPDYVIAFSTAHEMAHQRGIAREDEANFTAFLVLYESDDNYLRYCALLELYDYLSDALYSADEELFYKAFMQADRRIVYEMLGFNDFFTPYTNSVASDIMDTVNDVSIKLRGDSDGVKSYNMMVELAASYFGISGN